MSNFIGFVAALAYSAGAVICHQAPERSFFLAGRQWPVCARCAGLYAGVAIGLIVWLVVRRVLPSRRIGNRQAIAVLALMALPTLVSWAGGVLHFWDGTNAIRAVLALPLGITAGAFVAGVTAKDLR